MKSTSPEYLKNGPLFSVGLFAAIYISILLQNNAPRTKNKFMKEYDYIIVGAGSAGSVVANRLSECECVNVLLLEAGEKPPNALEIPTLGILYYNSVVDWNYLSTPVKKTAFGIKDQRIPLSQGKMIGGSSQLNDMLYIRGNRKNYDKWAEGGAKGWSYEEVLPYFIKAENNQNPGDVDDGFHGFCGPLTVEIPRYHPMYQSVVREGAMSVGYPLVDVNGRSQIGITDFQSTMRNGQRCSTSKAYLKPAESRKNLDIVDKAFVTKVVIEDGAAVGVEFDRKLQHHQIRAKREVILSAGAINTPKILMLSGIGPQWHLDQMGIPVVADLEVGSNQQDHCYAFVIHQLNDSVRSFSEEVTSQQSLKSYAFHRKGPLASSYSVTNLAFLSNEGPKAAPNSEPDHELYFIFGQQKVKNSVKNGSSLSFEEYQNELRRCSNPVYCASSLLHPRSRGSVRLSSSDPYDDPVIDLNYFDDDRDFTDLLEGMKHCSDILSSEPMKKLGSRPAEPPFPGCEEYFDDKEEYFSCSARRIIVSEHHHVGTAKMGDPKRPGTVVDPTLRVVGVKNLRVVDASVMPTIPSGNTNAATIMVAEKASDIIKKTMRGQYESSDGPWEIL